MNINRIFMIVLDSLGIGELPDAAEFGDVGSNTLRSIAPYCSLSNLSRLGLFNIDGIDYGTPVPSPKAAYGRMSEKSHGKDTTVGHWELCGVISDEPLPVFPDGFPDELIEKFEAAVGHKVICNKPYSGTQVIYDYGREHIETGALIVYTSADSVFQIAAHEEHFGLDELYRCCEIAREMLVGKYGVGRVIARPFVGEFPNYTRTANRHDYSVKPPEKTLLDRISETGLDVISIGKIVDIFAGSGITRSIRTTSNADGMDKLAEVMREEFGGLCFVNLVDFDAAYGHRNDVAGYAKALGEFDKRLGELLPRLDIDDLLIITADHGCDPATPSTDHSREYVPLLVYGAQMPADPLGTLDGFDNVSRMISDILGIGQTGS